MPETLPSFFWFECDKLSGKLGEFAQLIRAIKPVLKLCCLFPNDARNQWTDAGPCAIKIGILGSNRSQALSENDLRCQIGAPALICGAQSSVARFNPHVFSNLKQPLNLRVEAVTKDLFQ